MDEWKQSIDKLSPGSLLVSTPDQVILRFYCPIPAICKKAVAGIAAGEQVHIQGIYQETNHELLYLIDGQYLPHSNFHLNL